MPDVYAVDAYGDVGLVDESLVADLEASGGRLATDAEVAAKREEEQFSTPGEIATGLVEAGARGATLGLSDPLLTEALGEDYRRNAAARQRQTGAAGQIAEVGGALAPLLVSGGTSGALTAGKLGATAVRGVGAPVRAAAALGRGAEAGVGALARGAGIAGEGILSRGALTGAKLAASGAVEGGIYGAGQALSEAALAPGGNYDHLGEKMWAGAKTGAKFGAIVGGGLGFMGGAGVAATKKIAARVPSDSLKKLSEETAVHAIDPSKKAARELQNTGRTRSTGRELLDRDIVAAGRSTDDMLTRASAVREEMGDEIGTLIKRLDDAGETFAPKKMIAELDELVAKRADSLSTKHRAVAKQLKREFAPLIEAAEAGTLTHGELHRFRRELDTTINWSKAEQSAIGEDLVRARGIVEGALESSADEAAARLGDTAWKESYRKAKSGYGAARWAEKQLNDNMARGQANRFISLTDTIASGAGMAAGMATGSFGLGALATVGAGLANKMLREKGAGVIATLANRASKSDAKLSSAIKGFFKKGGDIRRGLIGEGGAGEVEAKSRIERTLGRKGDEPIGDAYRRRLKQISDFDPSAMPGIGAAAKEAPNATAAAVAVALRGRQHLLETAPTTTMGDDPLQPHVIPPQANSEQVDKWTRRLEVVDDPLGTIERGLRDNTLMREHVETLKLVYPETFADVRKRLWNEIADSKERIPYEQRIRLGVLFELPTDKSLRPANVARAQALYQQPSSPDPSQLGAQQQPGPMGPMTNIANSVSTATQNIEGGNMEF